MLRAIESFQYITSTYQLTSAKLNYGVGDKELLAIYEALKEYFPYIESLAKPVSVLTDHSNLSTFSSKRALNYRQAR